MGTVFITHGTLQRHFVIPDLVCVAMSFKSLLCFGALISVALAQNRLDASNALPLHYTIETTVDVLSRKFSSEGSIVIHLLKDTSAISFFANGLVSSWLPSSLENEDGETFEAILFVRGGGSDHRTLVFKEEFKGGFNYTLHFPTVEGTFGNGLVQVLATSG